MRGNYTSLQIDRAGRWLADSERASFYTANPNHVVSTADGCAESGRSFDDGIAEQLHCEEHPQWTSLLEQQHSAGPHEALQ